MMKGDVEVKVEAECISLKSHYLIHNTHICETVCDPLREKSLRFRVRLRFHVSRLTFCVVDVFFENMG